MNVVIEDNVYLEKFFKLHNQYTEKLKEEIYNNILIMINERPHKIKDVNKLKYKGKTIYEYKIILDKSFVCRVAYVILEDSVIVFYLSTNIIKAVFTKEVSKLKGVTK